MGNQEKAILFVDGSVLKRRMWQLGQQQTPQLVLQYLSHMVQAIRQQMPKAHVFIQYYGARLNEPLSMPISGQRYCEPEIKMVLKRSRIPGATLQCNWGKVTYPSEQPWILKPECYHKDNLTDADFILNEKPKGVLAQLVSKLAECAVRMPQTPLYVYGDAEDMAYALHMSQWLGAKVQQIEFAEKRPSVSVIPQAKEPRFFDKKQILQMGQAINNQPDKAAYLQQLRMACSEQDKKAVLMLDMGVIRKHLEQQGYRMNVHNVQVLLQQIKATLPVLPDKTVLYCSFTHEKKLISPFTGVARALVDSSEDKHLHSLSDAEVSTGKTVQDKMYPAILKKEKWHTSAAERGYKDFDYNFHQLDVDDRIVYDMTLYSMDPTVSQLYMLATDGDFAHPVEQAAQMGLPTSLIHLDFGKKDLSYRLQQEADETIVVFPSMDGLISKEQEEENKRAEQKARSNVKRKQLQRMQRFCARAEKEESDVPQPTREERWRAACRANRREIRSQIQRRQ